MAALTTPRWAPEFTIHMKLFPLSSNATAFRGGMCAADTSSGVVRPATNNNANLINIGQFLQDVTTTTSTATQVNVALAREIWVAWYDNATGTNAVVATNLFANCYMLDDHTVTMATGTGSSVAGRVWDIDASMGVLVQPNGF